MLLKLQIVLPKFFRSKWNLSGKNQFFIQKPYSLEVKCYPVIHTKENFTLHGTALYVLTAHFDVTAVR
jgi:hypothetical protein